MLLDVNPIFIPGLLAGACLAILAVVVFISRPSGGLNRSFSLLLFLDATVSLLRPFASGENLWERLREDAIIGLPFVLVFIGYQLLVCYGPSVLRHIPQWFVLTLVGVAGGITEWIFMSDHTLFLQPVAGSTDAFVSGRFGWIEEAHLFLDGLLALLFAMAIRSRRLGVARRSLRQAMQAFAVVPAYYATFILSGRLWMVLGPEHSTWYNAFAADNGLVPALLLAGSLSALATALVVTRVRADAETRAEGGRYGWVLAAAIGTGLITMTAGELDAKIWHFVVIGLWHLVAALLLAGPVLRDHILDIDYRVDTTIRRGVTVTILSGIVFAVVNVVANMLTNAAGLSVGGLAAVVLLFALGPMQHVSDRLTAKAIPKQKALGSLDQKERRKLYTEQAELAWSDGMINRKERLFLDSLARRLGLGVEETARLEHATLKA